MQVFLKRPEGRTLASSVKTPAPREVTRLIAESADPVDWISNTSFVCVRHRLHIMLCVMNLTLLKSFDLCPHISPSGHKEVNECL